MTKSRCGPSAGRRGSEEITKGASAFLTRGARASAALFRAHGSMNRKEYRRRALQAQVGQAKQGGRERRAGGREHRREHRREDVYEGWEGIQWEVMGWDGSE